MSDSPGPSTPKDGPVNRHMPTAVELQRQQLARLLKDPAKPVAIPAPPKEKTLRPPREMMKNVQGSSAGAGSGEFHVYKQNRRREYERLKLMEEKSKEEAEAEAFEQRKRERDEATEAKTAKNRAKRQKKKAARSNPKKGGADAAEAANTDDAAPLKKRRLLGGGDALVFRRPGEGDDSGDEVDVGPMPADTPEEANEPLPVIEETKIIIHDDD